ncbi:MAG: molybdopterin-dependent oxidoreductase, partial [Acetobacteraceae bacterium]|nr:molybdopterin-dependent oxidoreductase [Acetobacteraceae bacterium]
MCRKPPRRARRGEAGDRDQWDAATIGNAVWTGARLQDVLQAAGCKIGNGHDMHVAFDSVDEIEKEGERFSYGASIPIRKALHPEVLFAY